MKKSNKSKSACETAAEYGIDLSLLEVNLKKTPAQRIRDMNMMLNGINKIKEAANKNAK